MFCIILSSGGIERRKIFWDDRDRENFLDRLGRLWLETKTRYHAWAFLQNHAHFLFRTGEATLANFLIRMPDNSSALIMAFSRANCPVIG